MNCRLLPQVIASLCTAAFAFASGVQPEGQPTNVISLAPDVQQEITRVVTVLSAGDMSEEAVQEVVKEFKSFKNKPPQELLLQVLAVYGGKEEYRSNPRVEMAKRLLFSNLLQGMTPSDVVAAVAPKYEQTSDPKLEYGLRQALGMATLRGGRVDSVDPDFGVFSIYIGQNKDQPPRKLIEFMYGHNPQVAVLSMARIYGDKTTESQLADLFKGDPKRVVQSFADRPEWWVRLYVPAVMKKNSKFRDEALLKKLEQDDNPLVREKVSKLKDQLQPK